MAKKKTSKKTKKKSNKSKSKNNNKKPNPITKAWGTISTAASSIVTLQLITGSGMAESAGQAAPDRAKNFINVLSGKVLGYTPFKKSAGANTVQTLSIDGMFNKYTGIALGLLGYAAIPVAKKYLPHQGKAKSLGRKVLGGALLGGLFSTEGLGQNPHNHNMLTQSHATPTATTEGLIP